MLEFQENPLENGLCRIALYEPGVHSVTGVHPLAPTTIANATAMWAVAAGASVTNTVTELTASTVVTGPATKTAAVASTRTPTAVEAFATPTMPITATIGALRTIPIATAY